MQYSDFIGGKSTQDEASGFEPTDLNNKLYDFQHDITDWTIRRGRAAIFADCGMGKTPMQLSWADKVRSKGNVLIVAPLAVSAQTVREGDKFGIKLEYRRDGEPSKTGITITNYEMLKNFCPDDYAGIVLDESSILKSYTSKTRNEIIDVFGRIPYKLACTATPSPNDIMELGNHSEFLGAMPRTEMLSMFFVNDMTETQKWRIKGHAKSDFWKWVCSWAVMIRKPSDLGYDDGKFILPPLTMHEHVVDVDHSKASETLFLMEAQTLQERQRARRDSVEDRCKSAADIMNNVETGLIWCDRNDESAMLKKMIDGAIEVKGSDSPEHKEKAMLGFSDGTYKKLISKPSICGFGMNWQHCNQVAFVGLSDSYEQFYQAVRRVYRFGQTSPVDCHIIISTLEGNVLNNIKRKEKQATDMAEMMTRNMSVYNSVTVGQLKRRKTEYKTTKKMEQPKWM